MNLTEHKMKLKSTLIDKTDDRGNAAPYKLSSQKHLEPLLFVSQTKWHSTEAEMF